MTKQNLLNLVEYLGYVLCDYKWDSENNLVMYEGALYLVSLKYANGAYNRDKEGFLCDLEIRLDKYNNR
jgi:hypothetical protein